MPRKCSEFPGAKEFTGTLAEALSAVGDVGLFEVVAIGTIRPGNAMTGAVAGEEGTGTAASVEKETGSGSRGATAEGAGTGAVDFATTGESGRFVGPERPIQKYPTEPISRAFKATEAVRMVLVFIVYGRKENTRSEREERTGWF